MARSEAFRIGLLIRSGPWEGRSNRDQLDIALAAAVMGMELELYFLGAGILQLLAGREGSAAQLPAGSRAWLGLGDLAPTRVFAEQCQLRRLRAAGLDMLLEPEPLDPPAMRARQRGCDRVVVL